MKRYRIKQGNAYNGCIPITVYWVQVLDDGLFSSNWRNIKGFDTYKKAKELLDILIGNNNE